MIFRSFILIVMLFAHIGQSFAIVSMNCQDMHNQMSTPSGHHQSMQMDHHTDDLHANHSNSVSSSEHQSNDSCCGDECMCPSNGCSFTVFILPIQNKQSKVSADKACVHYLTSHYQTPQTSLFRPPISA